MSDRPVTVLIIEDDPSIRTGLTMSLRAEGYRVLSASDCAGGLRLAKEQEPDLMLLDLMLPGGSGLSVLQALRALGRDLPVLILTALGQEEDVVRGLKLGADDYIKKPFHLAELLARIEAALRRSRLQREKQRDAVLVIGDLCVRPSTGEVNRAGTELKLSPKELELLLLFMKHPDRLFSRNQLLTRIWGEDYEGTARTVDNHIYQLRAKIEPDPAHPKHLQTVHGLGYRFKRE